MHVSEIRVKRIRVNQGLFQYKVQWNFYRYESTFVRKTEFRLYFVLYMKPVT